MLEIRWQKDKSNIHLNFFPDPSLLSLKLFDSKLLVAEKISELRFAEFFSHDNND